LRWAVDELTSVPFRNKYLESARNFVEWSVNTEYHEQNKFSETTLKKVEFVTTELRSLLEVKYPITVKFHEDNTEWIIEKDDLGNELEWFDSEDPKENVTVIDAQNRELITKIIKLELVYIYLKPTAVQNSKFMKYAYFKDEVIQEKRSIIKEHLSKLLPNTNPDFDEQYPNVSYWWLELNSLGTPIREIGFNPGNSPIVAGPIGRNRGVLTDSNTRFENSVDDDKIRAEFQNMFSRFAKDSLNTSYKSL